MVLNAWTNDCDIFIGSKSHVYVSFILVLLGLVESMSTTHLSNHMRWDGPADCGFHVLFWRPPWTTLKASVRLNLINHVLVLFRDKFACNTTLRNPVFRWESCKSSVWESVKKCSRLCSEAGTCGWISREARSLQAAKSCTHAEHVGELNSHASRSTTGQKSRLAI